MLDGKIEIKVLQVTGKIARLGIDAPQEVDIERAEMCEEWLLRNDTNDDTG